jgi:hypothetical protein
MRINRFWKFHKWLPVALGVPKMLEELSRKPKSRLLGFQVLFGIPLLVQYWRSFQKLQAYTKDRSSLHYPGWQAFNRKIRSSGDVELRERVAYIPAALHRQGWVLIS